MGTQGTQQEGSPSRPRGLRILELTGAEFGEQISAEDLLAGSCLTRLDLSGVQGVADVAFLRTFLGELTGLVHLVWQGVVPCLGTQLESCNL